MGDLLVDTAIANWGPRFTANGVDATDFASTTSSVSNWDDWCTAWSRTADGHDALGRVALEQGRRLSAGEHFAHAALCYHFAKFLFVHDLAQARAAHRRAVTCLGDALPLLDPPGRRVLVPFEGIELAGVLRCPPGDGPHPAVVLVAGLDSAKEEFGCVEKAFLDRGLATFSFDGPGQGEAEWEMPARPAWETVGTAVCDRLASCPEIDGGSIGVWGVSLGGYYAARMASGEPRLAACVSLSGPFDLGAAWDGLNPLTKKAFQVRAGCATPAEAARAAASWSLEGLASSITVPLLAIVGRRDRLFSWHDGERLVEESSGPARLVVLDEGNHGCANVVYRHRPLAGDWMAEQLTQLRTTAVEQRTTSSGVSRTVRGVSEPSSRWSISFAAS